jgi:hypothetical protein
MKTYNTKLGVLVFTVLAAIDVVIILGHSHPASWLMIPWSVINFPVALFMYIFQRLFQNGSMGMSCLYIGSLLFSAALWSFIASYVFRRRIAA